LTVLPQEYRRFNDPLSIDSNEPTTLTYLEFESSVKGGFSLIGPEEIKKEHVA